MKRIKTPRPGQIIRSKELRRMADAVQAHDKRMIFSGIGHGIEGHLSSSGGYSPINNRARPFWAKITGKNPLAFSHVGVGGIDATSTTLPVTGAANFPTSGYYLIQVESEYMEVRGGHTTNSWTVARGMLGTTPAAHAAGATIIGYDVSYSYIEQEQRYPGFFEDATYPRIGTVNSYPAFEVNGNEFVPTGAIVQMWLGYDGLIGSYYLFAYPEDNSSWAALDWYANLVAPAQLALCFAASGSSTGSSAWCVNFTAPARLVPCFATDFLSAKGDIYTHNLSKDTRLPVGSDGQFLRASSTADTGLVWDTLDAGDIPNLPASIITSGTFDPARLGTGVANNTKFLRGDGTWQDTSSIGGSTVTSVSGTTTDNWVTIASFNGKLATWTLKNTDLVATLDYQFLFTDLFGNSATVGSTLTTGSYAPGNSIFDNFPAYAPYQTVTVQVKSNVLSMPATYKLAYGVV